MKTICAGLLLLLAISTLGQPKPKKASPTKTAPVGISTGQSASLDSLDKETGLTNDNNLMLVKAHCTPCHSSKLILQHRFSREGWKDKIRWMQKNHKLWDLGESESLVLDYLEKYYSKTTYVSLSLRRQRELKAFIWYKL
ncbi:MAG: hypothetical protein U0Y10_23565 [Spirosomataceae bacterium]